MATTPELVSLTPHEIEKQLNWRYATKLSDKSHPISPEHWKVLTDALRLAPSYFGLQPWRFLIVESPEVREKLATAARSIGASSRPRLISSCWHGSRQSLQNTSIPISTWWRRPGSSQ